MQITAFTIRLLILFLPGLIAAVIVERLTVHPKWEQFRFAVYSLMLGCAVYVLYQVGLDAARHLAAAVAGCEYSPRTLAFWAAMFDSNNQIVAGEVLVACCLAAILGLLLTCAVQKKWMHRLARRIRVSDKFGDENLFTYFLNSPETAWLWIRDHNHGVIYEGMKHSMSEASNVCELVLTEVRVYHDITRELLYELPAVYLSFQPGRFSMEMAHSKGGDLDSTSEANHQ